MNECIVYMTRVGALRTDPHYAVSEKRKALSAYFLRTGSHPPAWAEAEEVIDEKGNLVLVRRPA